MALLTTSTITAPSLFTTNKVKATQYKDAVDTLSALRDTLQSNHDTARARAEAIPNEIAALRNELSGALLAADRTAIKASIVTLEAELEDVRDVMGLDIKAAIEGAIESAGIYALQAEAKAEHDGWFNEIKAYVASVDSIYNETRAEIKSLKDSNIFRVASENLDDITRGIR